MQPGQYTLGHKTPHVTHLAVQQAQQRQLGPHPLAGLQVLWHVHHHAVARGAQQQQCAALVQALQVSVGLVALLGQHCCVGAVLGVTGDAVQPLLGRAAVDAGCGLFQAQIG